MNINLTLIGQSIAFAIFVWFCLKYVWPPFLRILEDRRTRIADGLAAAEQGRRDQEMAEEKSKEVLQEARDQAKDIIAQAQRRADEIVDEAKGEARVEGERLVNAARSDIDQQMNQAREQLRKEVASIALDGVRQVLGREVKASDHDEALNRLAAQL